MQKIKSERFRQGTARFFSSFFKVFVGGKAENLKPALESEGVTWPQIIDTDEMAGKLYGVTGIPHIILFAPDGTILKRGLRGEGMVQVVTEVMTKK